MAAAKKLSTSLLRFVTDCKVPEEGFWFAGQKYVLVNHCTLENDDELDYFWEIAVCPKWHVHIFSTEMIVVCGLFSSDAHTSIGVCLDYEVTCDSLFGSITLGGTAM